MEGYVDGVDLKDVVDVAGEGVVDIGHSSKYSRQA